MDFDATISMFCIRQMLLLLVYWELIVGLHMRTGNTILVEYVLVLLEGLLR
jgi:hypothetical protein